MQNVYQNIAHHVIHQQEFVQLVKIIIILRMENVKNAQEIQQIVILVMKINAPNVIKEIL